MDDLFSDLYDELPEYTEREPKRSRMQIDLSKPTREELKRVRRARGLPDLRTMVIEALIQRYPSEPELIAELRMELRDDKRA